MEVRNRFKGLDLIDRVPDELWNEIHDIVQETQETWFPFLGWRDPLEKENGNPLQGYRLENPMDGRAWQATVHVVIKSQT